MGTAAIKTCSVGGCGRPHEARGWCRKHYRRWQTHGDPLKNLVPARGQTLDWKIDRAEAEAVSQPNGCRLFAGPLNSGGYGLISRGGRPLLAHRLICERHHGPPPVGKPWALHSCDTPRCVNPAHLRWGSPADNAADRDARGRFRSGWEPLSDDFFFRHRSITP